MPGFMRAIRKVLSPEGGGGLDLPNLGMKASGFEPPPEPTEAPRMSDAIAPIEKPPAEDAGFMESEEELLAPLEGLDEVSPEMSISALEGVLGEGDLIDAEVEAGGPLDLPSGGGEPFDISEMDPEPWRAATRKQRYPGRY